MYDHQRPKYGSTENYHTKQSGIDISVGVERTQELTKRWQVYYGLDIRPSWTYSYTDFTHSSGGYQYGDEDRGTYFAVAPVLGIRYRIAKRFSILTEASLSFIKSTVKSRNFSIPLDDQNPQLPDLDQTTNNVDTRFQTPIAVVATFDL